MSNGNLKVQVQALQLNLEGLLKLLGGSAADREKFWEILRGITSPQIVGLVEANLASAEAHLQATTKILGALKSNAKGFGT